MKTLLYIGNNLQHRKSNVSYIGILGPLLVSEGYEVRYASSKPNKLARFLHMGAILIRHRKTTDLVLIDTYSTLNFYYALMVSQLCRLMKMPYIPILHGGNLPSRLKTNPRLSSMVFKNAQCNVAPSRFMEVAFKAQGFSNLTYIPNTIEINNYDFKPQRYMSAPKLLWVRSFSKIYNPAMAVHVLKYLRDLGIDATLCMIGPDSDGSLQEVKDLADHLGVTVTFTGKLTKSEWTHLSKEYSVFINTTTVDNTPVSVIEAMALGLPVVSTDVGGMPYLITTGFNGFLLEEHTVEAMANAIIDLMHNTEVREAIIHNARTLSESFDWTTVRTKWHEILKI